MESRVHVKRVGYASETGQGAGACGAVGETRVAEKALRGR